MAHRRLIAAGVRASLQSASRLGLEHSNFENNYHALRVLISETACCSAGWTVATSHRGQEFDPAVWGPSSKFPFLNETPTTSQNMPAVPLHVVRSGRRLSCKTPAVFCSALNPGSSRDLYASATCLDACGGCRRISISASNLHSCDGTKGDVSTDEYREEVDRINAKFGEAREEIELAMESKETVYFNEEAASARAAVQEVLDRFENLLARLGDQERGILQRSMGLKMEQLKGELEQLNE